MKATGIVRRIDDLGRVVIPKEIRRNLGIREGDPLELFVADGGVLFKLYNPMGEGNFRSVYDALSRAGIQYAVYSTNYLVKVNGEGFPNMPDPKWSVYRTPHEKDNARDFYLTPILSNGDLWGHIAYLDTNNHKLIELAANIMSNML